MRRKNKKRKCSIGRKRPAGPMTRRDRKACIVEHLKPLQGHSVYNRNIGRPVKFTSEGIDEIGQHGQYSGLSMAVAMDAPNQARKAVKVSESKAKENGKQRKMRIKRMITLAGKYKGVQTKVNVGKTANGTHKLYSVTTKKKRS